jgi:molybdenum cofactor cytidylyltransferase
MPALCGVILAAGASTRMGRDKALLPWPPHATTNESAGAAASGATLLAAQIVALRPHAQAVIVVAGRNAERLEPVIAECGAEMVVNPEPERGQFSSLQTGLRAVVERGFDAAMITPVDCPPLSAGSMAKLCTAFERALARGLWAVMPEHQGRHGHPLVAGRGWIEAILKAPVESNAREVKRAHEQYLLSVRVPDSQVSTDMNTPEEYAALRRFRK